jgi:AAA+ ATPase superfamily predicted ATPase
MNTEKIIFFPPGIVTGTDFCNRKAERNYLRTCITENTHIVLSSPRRYGKTSLISQVVKENRVAFHSIDLLPANNHEYVKKAILDGAGKLLYRILPKHKQAEQKVLQLFKNLNPKFVINALGQTIELSAHRSPQKSIMEVLVGLDKAAQELGQKVVFIMDEFQQIESIHENHSIEASIRHAVERSKHVTYIFSGSNRHLLAQMFTDRNRPLYHLCELLKLDRISQEDFRTFLRRKAKQKWKKQLTAAAINEILELTECHPYYVNSLCRSLWRYNEPSTKEIVSDKWAHYVNEQHSWISDDISNLSANQRTILAALAYEPINEPQGQLFSRRVGLIPASIKRAMNTLLKKDYIYKNQKGFYKVLDPSILYYLNSITYFDFE